MSRTDVINFFIGKYDYKKYLEIGIAHVNLNFSFIKAEEKVSVDPNPLHLDGIDYLLTSDDFFKQNKRTFDIIFIDGLHESEQVYRDIINSLGVLNEGGTVLIHDCNPTGEIIQRVPCVQEGAWTGDCWKAFVRFRTETTDYNMFVIDTDWGVGVIRKSNVKIQPLVITEPLVYFNMDNHRKEWLNLIEKEDIEMILNRLDNE